MKIALRLALFLPLFFLGACTPSIPGTNPPTSSHVVIDWVNAIHFNGTTYLASFSPQTLPVSKLGPLFGTTKFKVDGNVQDPNYHLKDGDATYLPVGTPVYTVKGSPSTAKLATNINGVVTLYEAIKK